jgi:acyl carrier protein
VSTENTQQAPDILTTDDRAVIRAAVCEILEIDDTELTPDDNLAEVHEADSLDRMEIMSRIEEHFLLKFDRSDIKDVATLADLYRLTADRLAELKSGRDDS